MKKKLLPVRWTVMAANDLERICDHIAVDNLTAAGDILQKIRKAARDLERHPFKFRAVPELAELGLPQYRDMVLTPYRVIYKVIDDAVFVIAIFDGRRDIESLLLERMLYGK